MSFEKSTIDAMLPQIIPHADDVKPTTAKKFMKEESVQLFIEFTIAYKQADNIPSVGIARCETLVNLIIAKHSELEDGDKFVCDHCLDKRAKLLKLLTEIDEIDTKIEEVINKEGSVFATVFKGYGGDTREDVLRDLAEIEYRIITCGFRKLRYGGMLAIVLNAIEEIQAE